METGTRLISAAKSAAELLGVVENLERRAVAARQEIEEALSRLDLIEARRRVVLAEDDEAQAYREVSLEKRETALRDEAHKVRAPAVREGAEARAQAIQEGEDARAEGRQFKERLEQEAAQEREIARALIEDKVAGFKFVAKAWADIELATAERGARLLETKSHPALKAAEAVRAKGADVAEAIRRAKAAEWTVALYEYHLPWITELLEAPELESYTEERDDPAPGGRGDPAARFLSKEEYAALPDADRNQRALDRYLKSRKSPWQLGRDYERYVGYLREQEGFAVTYHGIAKGLEDLGRDVLAERDDSVEVIQCKRWARSKTIHEKHVFQLFGTVTLARLENPGREVSGTFTTTTKLSPKAREVAEYLEIKVEEGFPLADYPRIKCNIGRRDEGRIYHLPFDQQYDTTVIEPDRGEAYVATVAEAEALGFRRAWRWKGPQP
jgi:hypothetical protein